MSRPATPATEPAHDVLRSRDQRLGVLFSPRTVAVIGATDAPGSVGRTILWNLISSPFGGTVFPVNPKRPGVLGIRAYPAITAVPAAVDLAVIVTPAAAVPAIVGECVAAGVKGAIIISAGFKETGADGTELERQVLEQLRRGRMRAVGPNCLGVMSPRTGLNATFAATIARPGNVAFVSQSGALLTAILDWSLLAEVGFSAFLSLGSMLDVGWGDVIDYLADDPHTQSIIIYMESVGDARSFLSAAREVALRKPVIVIKAGRTQAAAKAAASHTGALTGSDEVLDAAFRRTGVLRVDRIADVFHMAEVLAKQPRPRGPRLAILTNAGGPGVLATDALIANGGELARLSPESAAALNQLLPNAWSHNNPVDILGDAGPERYARAVEIAAKDPASDGLLVILTPQAMTDPTQTAEHLKPYATGTGKPLLASWMGGAGVTAGVAILNRAGIPTFPYPDSAARAFTAMWRYSYNLRGLYETPVLPADGDGAAPDRGLAEQIIQGARRSGRTLLTEFESKQLLVAYRIPTVATRVAMGEAEAVRIADQTGYPVVLKLHSETVTHKTDVGGVQLNLADGEAVRRAYQAIESSVHAAVGQGHFAGVTVQPMIAPGGYEIILGSSIDPQFGPVLLFGTGGQLVEVFQDRALALPPLNTTLARRMMEHTHIFSALRGIRGGKPVDLAALEQLLVRFSQLVVEERWVKEIDINPLLVSSERLVALDARVVVYGPDTPADQLPRLAIRPYPAHYTTSWVLQDGTPVTIRPIRPEDESLMVRFHETLSEQSVYMRYFQALKLSRRVTHERLARMCFIDYDREMALVAGRKDPTTGDHEIMAIGRLIKLPGTDEAEFALLVGDQFQRCGLGTELLRRLLDVGRGEKVGRITADILRENSAMQRVCQRLGFRLGSGADGSLVKAEITL
ncbi:MAG TPA: bifunctional acetate--CoA ligase family protein/GNAT family N-acetyltransferase [Gemmataceae bacterium]|jgi:acetyltransferase|nr:bifunctional acetate--CoA ligase family protein/GNAT family N-acetyltransferase [Gemmataceae bacterium]